jgi:hypothetical protein
MGEAKRRREAGVMPEKTEKNWDEILTAKEKEEGRKDRAHMLQHKIPEIRGHYREALAKGMKRPVMVVADTRDDYGRQLLRLADERTLEVNKDYAEAGFIPTAIIAIPYGESALRVFGSMMTPNGRRGLEVVASMPKTIPVVVIVAHGNLYAGVPEEE